jgi:MoaA/NifB/PqqE/SkfB family radical SAM enzyme
MCYVHQQHVQKEELTAAQWLQLGETLRDRGMVFLLLTGGEPFLRKDFSEIYLGLRRLGLVVSVNTNGSLLTDEILDAFRKAPPSRVNVSMYGGNNHTYGNLCQNPAYDQVAENIIRLHSAGIQTRINATVNPYNVADVDAIYQFGKDHGLSVRGTAYMYPQVRVCAQEQMECKRFTPREAAECMLKFREYSMSKEQLLGMTSTVPEPDEECVPDGGPMRCRAGRTSFWVTWDGRLLPCGMFPTAGYPLMEMGFDEAWRRARQEVAQIVMPRDCVLCGKREHCGVCAASCMAESGDTQKKPAYICEMTEWLDQITQNKYGR